MKELWLKKIPQSLRDRRHWIVWQLEMRGGKETKVPMAKSNDPSTWTDFDSAVCRYRAEDRSGIGYMFAADDPFCGIDLDGCRNPKTGNVAAWAKAIIVRFDSYAEVSPSETGVKIFILGKSPFATGKKVELPDSERVCAKMPAVEVYDKLRYFAVTGWALSGMTEVKEAAEQLAWLKDRFWPAEPATPQEDFRSESAIVERARKYLAKLPAAISGQDGHGATFHAACVLVMGFDLSVGDALGLLREFNNRCQPQWSEKELVHKVESAAKQGGQRGYLRYAAPDNWSRIDVPRYQVPKPKPEPRQILLADAAQQYLDSIRGGNTNLIDLGIAPEVDYALGGGVERGEMVIFAARPSMGKSAAALQCVHAWTAAGMPVAMVSEEMSRCCSVGEQCSSSRHYLRNIGAIKSNRLRRMLLNIAKNTRRR